MYKLQQDNDKSYIYMNAYIHNLSMHTYEIVHELFADFGLL